MVACSSMLVTSEQTPRKAKHTLMHDWRKHSVGSGMLGPYDFPTFINEQFGWKAGQSRKRMQA